MENNPVWVKTTIAKKREDFPHKNMPPLRKEVFCKANGVRQTIWIEELKGEDGEIKDYYLTFENKNGRHQFAMSNLESFEWLDESGGPKPDEQGENKKESKGH